jgi:hypothetical protein
MGDECATTLLHTVGEREADAWSKQLLDVRTADVFSLLDLDDPEDLETSARRGSVF